MDGIPFSSLRTRRKEDQTHRLSKVFNILPLSAAVRWAKKIKRTIRQTVFDFPILTIIMYRNQKIKDFSHSKHLLSLLSLRGEFVLVKLFSENSLFFMHLTCFITVILDERCLRISLETVERILPICDPISWKVFYRSMPIECHYDGVWEG